MHGLLRRDRLTFNGEHYRLVDAPGLRRPQLPILVGGSARPGTAEPAARFADEYNTLFATADQLRDRKRTLDETCQRAGRDFEIEGRPPAHRADFPSAHDYAVSPAFFALFDISLVGGRRFTIDDRADHPPVAIISDSIARRFFGDESPLGKRVRVSGEEQPGKPGQWREIVGVVGTLYEPRPNYPAQGDLYVPLAQRPTCNRRLCRWSVSRTPYSAAARAPRSRLSGPDRPAWCRYLRLRRTPEAGAGIASKVGSAKPNLRTEALKRQYRTGLTAG